jgi:acetyl-CoA carboxylase biotin carboxyl carrier protein
LPDVEAHITGTVWKVECEVGQEVEEGDTLVILESMKMEMPVEAEGTGRIRKEAQASTRATCSSCSARHARLFKVEDRASLCRSP